MAILPYHDVILEYNILTHRQLDWLAFQQYLNVVLMSLLLLWILFNFCKFIIGQKKYRVWPLVQFYVLAAILLT